MALLEGRVLSVYNCAKEVGYTNISREIPRVVEDVFGVIVSRTPRKGNNRYGDAVTWTDYRLNITDYNKEGIKKMAQFVKGNFGANSPRTSAEAKAFKAVDQLLMF